MPPNDKTEERLFALIDKLVSSMDKMRRDMYIIAAASVLLFAAVTMARDGVFTKVGVPGMTFETHGTETMPPSPDVPSAPDPAVLPPARLSRDEGDGS